MGFMGEARTRKAEQSEATRGALLSVARELFAERGYAGTFTDEVAERAGVTRGALYHHFPSKKDLFQAVHEELEKELAFKAGVAATKAQGGSWEQLREGCQAFLDICLEPAIQQIVLLDAPSVLGWETWREIDAKYGLGLLRVGLQAAMDDGVIERQPADALAQVLLGALNEAAMLIARAEDVASARAEVGSSVTGLLDGLKALKTSRRAATRR
jgi:AcrR family transcriptional regulator